MYVIACFGLPTPAANVPPTANVFTPCSQLQALSFFTYVCCYVCVCMCRCRNLFRGYRSVFVPPPSSCFVLVSMLLDFAFVIVVVGGLGRILHKCIHAYIELCC
ncbi:unnamed protein product [Ceratitis capitata]|uniref:(Mediterranean fruit fly) hypothetical protein n=1 Tax=Ceratitis capitata TaxID=7213 RepID=A0A811UXR9_CERCA|nr:unnamed protein product [Ceratitis capitata]